MCFFIFFSLRIPHWKRALLVNGPVAAAFGAQARQTGTANLSGSFFPNMEGAVYAPKQRKRLIPFTLANSPLCIRRLLTALPRHERAGLAFLNYDARAGDRIGAPHFS
jgi:hypothetical protein